MYRFCIIVSGWNCEPFVKGCLDSIKAQTFKDFKVVIIDDASQDNTLIEIMRNARPEWDVISNGTRKGGFYNFDTATRETKDYEIAVALCLDDKLMPDALERINLEYLKGAWLTYGTWINKQGKIFKDLHHSDSVHANREYRNDVFRCTGIRTYYKKLYEKTQVYPMCEIERTHYYDLEYTWQMMEMCGKDRMGVITEPTYEYNNANPNNTAKLHGIERKVYNEICKRQKKNLILQL